MVARVALAALALVASCQAITPAAPAVAVDVSNINLPDWLSRSNTPPVAATTNLIQAATKPDFGDVEIPKTLPSPPAAMDPSAAKLSVAGKVFLALLGLFFAVELICYITTKLISNPLTEAQFLQARTALTLVPVFSVLILFVMFRAKKQGIDLPAKADDSEVIAKAKAMYGTMQTMYVIGMIGIYTQVLDSIDVTINSNIFGNVSSKFGPLAVTIGFFGCVYGALYVRDTSIPLSTSAECISYLSAIFLVIQLGMTFQTYKADMYKNMPGMDKMPKGGMDDADVNDKLDKAMGCLGYVPHAMIIFFFWYLLAEYAGFELQSWAQNCMYLAVWGIFLQALGVFGGKLGKFLRMLGLLLMFLGLCMLVYTAFLLHYIGLGPYTTPLTATALGLVGGIIIFAALIFIGTECTDSVINQEKKAILGAMTQCLNMGTVLAVLMLYVHFRALMIGATLPPMVFYACYGVAGALVMQCLICVIELEAVKPLLLAALYLGFGSLVTAALIMRPGDFKMPEDLYPDLTNPEPLVFSLVTILLSLIYVGMVVTRMDAENGGGTGLMQGVAAEESEESEAPPA